jgi:archaellum component FlaC
MDVFRKRRKEKDDAKAKEDGTIQGQLNRISDRLDAIDDYIKESDKKFERDNRRLNALEGNVSHIEQGINALARAELAHIQHDITGNHTDNLGRAETEITDYLTGRKGDNK